MELIYSQEALDDLVSIKSYMDEHAPEYSAQVLKNVLTKVRSLRQFPNRGKPIPERYVDKSSPREVYMHPYRIAYSVKPDLIEIITIMHEHRQV